jgi:hypothetical protein
MSLTMKPYPGVPRSNITLVGALVQRLPLDIREAFIDAYRERGNDVLRDPLIGIWLRAEDDQLNRILRQKMLPYRHHGVN